MNRMKFNQHYLHSWIRVLGIFSILLFLAPTVLTADEQEMRGTFRLITLTSVPDEIYYRSNGEYILCRPRLNRFSKVYDFVLHGEANAVLRFYVKTTMEADGIQSGVAPQYRHVGAVNIPVANSYMLFLQPEVVGSKGKPQLKELNISLLVDRFVRDDSDGWLLFNSTDKAIFSRLGSGQSIAMVEPHSLSMIPIDAEKDFSLIEFAAKIDGESQVFYSTAWPVYEGARYLVIFYERKDSGGIAVCRVAGGGISGSKNGQK